MDVRINLSYLNSYSKGNKIISDICGYVYGFDESRGYVYGYLDIDRMVKNLYSDIYISNGFNRIKNKDVKGLHFNISLLLGNNIDRKRVCIKVIFDIDQNLKGKIYIGPYTYIFDISYIKDEKQFLYKIKKIFYSIFEFIFEYYLDNNLKRNKITDIRNQFNSLEESFY